MPELSLIRSHEHMKQVCDFRGLRWGRIYPTDLDGMLDFGNQAFVLIEAKHAGGEVPVGQRIALERLVDGLQRGGYSALLLVAEHDTDDDIDVARCTVSLYRWQKRWYVDDRGICVRDAIDRFLHKHNLTRYLATSQSESDSELF